MGYWTDFVNTPMTSAEMAKARKLIARQKGKKRRGTALSLKGACPHQEFLEKVIFQDLTLEQVWIKESVDIFQKTLYPKQSIAVT